MDVIEKLRSVVRLVLGIDYPGAPVIDRMAMYRARVDAAAADGSTVDVSPESERLSPAKGIPVRVGVPGSVIVVQPGAVVLLGWEAGDPARPYAAPSWEAGAGTVSIKFVGGSIHINAGAGLDVVVNEGANPIARATVDTAGPYPIVGGALHFKG